MSAASGLLAATIFLSAFLLFLVQPVIAKLILPSFGGSAAVWATCLVFFQVALLCGYAYADRLVRRPALERVHLLVLIASLLLLPIAPSAATGATATLAPALQVLWLLAASVGLPFVLLATTSPLLQAWSAEPPALRNPYRLFAVSNLASLAALASYPWLIEPHLAAGRQALVWSFAYIGYALLLGLLVVARMVRAPAAALRRSAAAAPAPPGRRTAAWIALAALPSFELVAVTNHLTQNVPSIPMMWLAPLVLYLVTFVLCFDNDRWYRPRLFAVLAMLAVGAMGALLLSRRFEHDLGAQALVFLAALFVACMFCHGELARARPAPALLSRFYLAVAIGGAIGGALVGIAAPLLLPATFEVEFGLVALAAAVFWRTRRHGLGWSVVALLLLAGAVGTAVYRLQTGSDNLIAISRNFYGVLRVREYGSPAQPDIYERTLAHGGILHGEQYLAPERRRQPTSYYTETSGAGRLLRALADAPARQVGVVGLGAGTLAAYGRSGDRYTFFDIDPAIVDAARRHFSYLSDSAATIDVQIGDGRLLLQREAPARFDALLIDAFSGDSIPVHLLTREAIRLYADRTRADGVIALHLSNRYLDLRPVVRRIAEDLGLHSAYIDDPQQDGRSDQSSSDWILLAKSRRVLDLAAIREHASELPPAGPQHLWTDGFSNVVAVLRRDRLFRF